MMIGLGLSLTGAGAGGGPQQILGSSLLGYWDAERLDTLTLSGSSVTTWTDLVAGYAVTQATAASKPTYGAATYGGRPGITFDGVDDNLGIESIPFPTGATPCEIWVFADQQALPADVTTRRFVSYGNSSATSRWVERTVSGGVNRALTIAGEGVGTVAASNANVDLSGRHVLRGEFGATAIRTFVDATSGSAAAVVPATTGTGRFRIGASAAGTAGNFAQAIFSAVMITTALTADQAAYLRGFR